MPEDFWGNAIFSVIPTIVVGLIFWFTMRAIVRSDRSERETFSEVEAQERARLTTTKPERHE
jgi:cytochrome c-type biogenesis protein CcmH/NrfF